MFPRFVDEQTTRVLNLAGWDGMERGHLVCFGVKCWLLCRLIDTIRTFTSLSFHVQPDSSNSQKQKYTEPVAIDLVNRSIIAGQLHSTELADQSSRFESRLPSIAWPRLQSLSLFPCPMVSPRCASDVRWTLSVSRTPLSRRQSVVSIWCSVF